jgi:hypothetical protein
MHARKPPELPNFFVQTRQRSCRAHNLIRPAGRPHSYSPRSHLGSFDFNTRASQAIGSFEVRKGADISTRSRETNHRA